MNQKTLLIGGTSHLGKSTLAQQLTSRFEAKTVSTDHLARHPGRPWKASIDLLPTHVIEHYETLDTNELVQNVLTHYQKQWPKIQSIIDVFDGPFLIIEGSAIGPSWVATHLKEEVMGIWLIAKPELIQERIYQNSGYEERSEREQFLIDQFCLRSIRFNELVFEDVKQYALPYLEIDFQTSRTELAQLCITKTGWALDA